MNRVKTTTTTTGTGNVTVTGSAAARCLPLSSIAPGKQVAMMIEDESGTDWELSLCTILTATTFSRDTVLNGSAGPGVKVNFGAGTKTVFATMDANAIALVADVPFSPAIPLSRPGSSYMAASTVTGPLTFTAAAGAVRGALAYLRLTADGVNLPNFSAFKEWGGSSGYDNRAGIVNQLQFFYDGSDLFFSASQAVGAVPAAVPDTTAPTLTSPTSASTGTTTGSGSVTTNEGNGTLYWRATTNATESVASVKAGSSVAVTSIGSKAVTVASLNASTLYYLHFVQTDTAGNDSTRVTSASFTTAAAGDTTAPTLSTPTATKTGSTTATGSVTTNEANGTLYYMASANAVESAATVKAGASQAVTATGAQAVAFTGLPAASTLYGHYLHRDAAGNDSTVANTSSFVTDVAAPANYPRLTALASLVESGADPYTYTGNGGSFANTIGGVSVKSLPANTDGTWDFKITAANEFLGGFCITQPLTIWGNWRFGVYAQGGAGAIPSTYKRIALGTNQVNAAGLAPAAGDILRFARVGNILKIQLARAAAPTVFVDMETADHGSAPQMWVQLLCSNTAAVQLLAQTGFA